MLKKIRKIFFNYWIDSYYLFRTDLQAQDPAEIPEPPASYSVKIMDNNSNREILDALGDLWFQAYNGESKDSAHFEVRTILNQGDVCFGIFYFDQLVGMGWHGEKAAIMRMDFAHYVKNERNVCIGHHGYVDPKHRGYRLQQQITKARENYAKMSGYRYSYAFVGINNMASVINLSKRYQHYKTITHIKIEMPFLSFNFFPKRAVSSDWLPLLRK